MPSARQLLKDPRNRITGLYLLFGIAWILFSDHLLALLVHEPELLTHIQTLKGWSFVLFTAVLLFILIGHYRKQDRQRLEALEEHDTRLKLLHNVASIGVWDWDMQSGTTHWSNEVEELFGLKRGGFDGSQQTWVNLIHPNDRDRVTKLVDEWFANPGRFSIEYRVSLPDGKERWLLSYGNTTYDSAGKPLRLLGINMDITERKRVEKHLHQSEAVYQTSRDAIVITDTFANVVSANPAFKTITGYTEEEVRGKNIRFLKSSHHDHNFYHNMWHALEQSGGWSGEIWNRRKDSSIFPGWMSISSVRDDDGHVINYVGILSDLSQLKSSEAELEYLANHDSLTDLPNRRLLDARLEHTISQAKRHHYGIAVLLLDIDRFKDINDSLGLEAGDELLRETARRVTNSIRGEDTVARLGGDELLIVLDEIKSPHHAAEAARNILDALAPPFHVEEHELFLTASIGISLYPDNGKTPEQLIRNADAAVYRAKEQGRNRIDFYSESLSNSAMERLSLIAGLRHAISNNELELHYQPQLLIDSRRIDGVEALVRWRHPEKGLIPPDNFIPLAEQTGLIESVGEWVLEESCRQMAAWLETHSPIKRVSVNISAHQLGSPNLIQAVSNTLAKYNLPPQYLELELTETAIMLDPQKSAETLDALANLGISLAVDDFGTGYSSLAYLQRLRMHRLKIDRTFVHDVPANKNNAAICRAVIAMAHSLGMETIAEGVEQEHQYEYLSTEQCTIAQGWLFARAMPAAELEAWVEQSDTPHSI